MLERIFRPAAIAICAMPIAALAQAANPITDNGAGAGSKGAQVSSSSNEVSADQPAALQEIIVTAQKREQNLQDVPISVTALGQKELTVNRVLNILDLNAIAPNLTVHLAAGGTSVPEITLRGEESFGGIPGEDRQVSIYLDGVYLGFAVGSLFDLADVDRIEVLKGPQGTLFGRNATAGAISIVTKNPTGKLGVHEVLTGGNYSEFESKTRVDLPSWGPFSAMFSFLHEQHRGDIQNLGAGMVWHYPNDHTYTSPKWLGSDDTNAVTAALKFDPTSNFSAIYKFDWTEDHSTPEGVGLAYLNLPALTAIDPGLPALLAAQPNPAALTKVSLSRPKAVNNSFSTPNYLRTYGHNVTATWNVSDHISIKDIASYRSSYSVANYQLDGFGGLVIPGTTIPFVLFGISKYAHTTQWSNETQANFKTDLFNFTGGYVHFHSSVTLGAPDGLPNLQLFSVLPGGVVPSQGIASTFVSSNSDAVYGQAEVHITPRLDFIGGYRYTWDSKSGTADNPGLPTSFTYSGSSPSYLADINYKITKDILAYAKYSTAYVSGGATFGVPFKSEHAKSWEGGLKADWFEHRLRTNLAIWTVKYDNIQTETSGNNLIPALPQLGEAITNVGDARARGVEFEATVVPVAGLTFNGSTGYTDFKYLTVSPGLGTLATFLPVFRPKWTANVGSQYESEPVLDDGRIVLGVDANYRSRMRISPYPPTAATAATASSPHSWIVNARLGLEHIQLPAGKASVALWVKNLTNDKTIDFGDDLVLLESIEWQRARAFGIDFSFDF